MIYIVTALAQEAIPLIQHFKLKKDLSHTKFDIYRNDMIKLIVSGTGKLKYVMTNSNVSPTACIFTLSTMSPIVLDFEPSLGGGLSISHKRIAVHTEKTI